MELSDLKKTHPPYVLHSRIDIPYYWAAGDFLARFFEGLKKAVLLASKCPKCQFKSCPPRRICKRCFVPTDVLEEVPHRATLDAFTYLNPQPDRAFSSPDQVKFYTGQTNRVWGLFKIDYCDSQLLHYINPQRINEIDVGARMKPIFRGEDQRKASILDIHYFDLLDKSSDQEEKKPV